MNHCTASSVNYNDCGHSFMGVNPSMNHRTGPTLICKRCGDSLKGVDPSMTREVYSHLQGLHRLMELSPRFYQPSRAVSSHLQGLRVIH